MKIIVSSTPNINPHLRQWIKELTDYTPQKIDEVLEQIEEKRKFVQEETPRVF